MPFESGEDPVGTARIRFRVHYYVFAVVFVVFDIIAAFAIPWAISWNMVDWIPVIALFLGMLVVVGYYALKGELEWV
ncbi:hypothetical protein B9P99_05885 [Candidatus Marsarchaeota G1 archaeon OSP_B]|jgi:NADH:ubiquinone oxidoreductase subunit 3 (chain A)|uniref:NADH-quinone oxidoreductase subunit n=1 Tax=Candidatus Marsarchaeota G1 archaeon OSP_B TaxID=1978153 RepID=A0A2R6AQ71_9ARCH|nr:MAG: hypothetical protein B9P99_05885 [Candidatus Marsarchaeota G1 archaeon OSP_B]